MYDTDASRWRAVATRDAQANGRFIYSIRTTNIYCRPTCPGRLARRANVGFYATPAEAEADGFRACKRCKPNGALEDPSERAVEKACALIEEALKNNNPKAIRLQSLARSVGFTPRYFHKMFKDRTGMTPREWAMSRRESRTAQAGATVTSNDGVTSGDPATFDWGSLNFDDFSDLVNLDPGTAVMPVSQETTIAAESTSLMLEGYSDMSFLEPVSTSSSEPYDFDLSFDATKVIDSIEVPPEPLPLPASRLGLDPLGLKAFNVDTQKPLSGLESMMIPNPVDLDQLEKYLRALCDMRHDAENIVGWDAVNGVC